MEATAAVRHVRMSPRKMRIIANIVRGKSVDEALGVLKLMPKKGAEVIAKLLSSAAANAEDKVKGKSEIEGLYIQSIQVDGGPIVKRWMPRAMGRANRVQRRTSHITVVVNDGEKS